MHLLVCVCVCVCLLGGGYCISKATTSRRTGLFTSVLPRDFRLRGRSGLRVPVEAAGYESKYHGKELLLTACCLSVFFLTPSGSPT
ncbi:hypothetical protein B0H66DRAFT_564569 [Apodospora peruviana]|uniref:Secreted protein n=1 Tax=Apodospora peruviana TaxID=516989 RepID=A0AAE0HYH5_9PEZI|nr:hypothetical protein B0H66DRAFT_564569 [Apodospora peruviana]